MTFEPNATTFQRFDYQLLQNGHVVLFWRKEVLGSARDALRQLGYAMVELDASAWSDTHAMHEQVSAALDFPDYYGHNLNALNDCLGDVARYEYGSDRTAAGLVLLVTAFDHYARREPDAAARVADIFAGVARRGLLFGHRMLCLLQVDDPRFSLPPVGATPVSWNHAEWLDSKRR
jgi:hypothetical protein